ncbi:MAG: HNH endonuclease [Actinomycetota bacterium]
MIDGIPHSLRRQVLRRDGHRCTFTGCRKKALLTPHHIEHDCPGGPGDMFNLTSLCREHHFLVHEGGWGVTRTPKGELIFFTPGGRRYDPGPDPPTPEEVPRIRQIPEHRLIEARSYLGALAWFI